MIAVHNIVKGRVAGVFVVLGLREMHGEAGAQLKAVNRADYTDMGAGEIWLPLTALVDDDHADRTTMTWKGQDGNQWRNLVVWVGNGYRTFTQSYAGNGIWL